MHFKYSECFLRFLEACYYSDLLQLLVYHLWATKEKICCLRTYQAASGQCYKPRAEVCCHFDYQLVL